MATDHEDSLAEALTGEFPGRDYHVRLSCRLCGGGLRPVLDLGRTPLANELPDRQDAEQDMFPLYLSQCVDCQHVQLPVVVNPQRLFHADYVYRSGTSPAFVKHLREFAREVQPARPGGFVVEVGSNDGTLLAEYQRFGHSVLGVDPSRGAADAAEAIRVPTIRAFFGRATLANWNLAGRKADLVVALNVFAHADDLGDIADGAWALLSDDGVFAVEVGYLPDMIARGVYRVCYHEHLSYHALRPLVSFLSRHGLWAFDAYRVPTQGGSIRLLAQPTPREYSPRLHDLLAREDDEAIDASRLTASIERDRASLHAILADARARGLKVAGYGAPAQLTTTAYALGLRHSDIAFVCDDSPLKQGKYTPGLHWPIVPPSALQTERPDLCVIFSANFSAQIIAAHPEFEGEWVCL